MLREYLLRGLAKRVLILVPTRLVSQVRTVFGVALPLRTVFEAPTIADMARAVAAAQAGGEGGRIERIGRDAPQQLLADLENLSEEQLDALLRERVAQEEGAE